MAAVTALADALNGSFLIISLLHCEHQLMAVNLLAPNMRTGFQIAMAFEFTVQYLDDSPPSFRILPATDPLTISVPFSQFLSLCNSDSLLRLLVQSTGLPALIQSDIIVQTIYLLSQYVARYHQEHVIPLYINFNYLISTSEYQEDDLSVAEEESMNSIQFVPACKAFVEALEKIEAEEDAKCVICMEEFCVGEEITKMPCSHLYHGDCIVQWLETSHFCPLCRCKFPT